MRLRRDTRGAAAVMLAVMVVPLLLFVGSAVDVARVYTVKARLQQACDAGALAGRRTMTDTSSSTPLDSTAVTQAKAFFNNNFHLGWMQTAAVTITGQPAGTVFVPEKTAESQVRGTATLAVPMAVMKMFGFQPITLTATCEARYDTADADIMFVLDQTGSMACLPSDDNDTTCKSYVGQNYVADGNSWAITEKTGSRIQALRDEVLTFFDKVTDANNVDPSTNFRFGFVPYNAAANVGKLLQPLGYMKTSATYQSRYVIGDVVATAGTPYDLNKNRNSCPTTSTPVRSPSTAKTYNNAGTAMLTTIYWDGSRCYQRDDTLIPLWQYAKLPVTYDTSQYITGAAVNNPAMADASTSTWKGCVEERNDPTSDNQTSFSMTSPPKDLDPDSAPTQASEKWSPWWGDVTFARLSDDEQSSDRTRTIYGRPYKYYNSWVWTEAVGRPYNEVACPLAAKPLSDASTNLAGNADVNARASAKAATRAAIKTYLSAANGFKPYGTTYHDVGMKWGLRLISPTGMFKNDTAPWTGHNAPNRFIIFLTDGDIETDPANEGGVYSEYGMERYDSRVANGATGNSNPSLDSYHNARFLASCQMAKNRNIKVFVIAFAQALTNELTTCASPGQAYTAANQTGLNTAFAAIAKQVAMLRLSK